MLVGIAVDDDYNIYILSELLPKKSLEDFVNENKGQISLQQKTRILLEVATAVFYLHSQKPPIIHRDIKPKNVFLSGDLTAKLGDFG